MKQEPSVLAIIPFYYGKNKFVNKKGGSPVDKKVFYLQKTILSLTKCFRNLRIQIFTADDISTQIALKAHNNITQISVPAVQLPVQSVIHAKDFIKSGEFDFVYFTEDDQILYLHDSVKEDLFKVPDNFVFSPHRWAKLFLGFLGRRKYYSYVLNKKRGFLDNFDFQHISSQQYRVNHVYDRQDSRFWAYAAAWFIHSEQLLTLLPKINLKDSVLETASYFLFDLGVSVLKLSVKSHENPGLFIVDHLSGYDYHRRKILPFLK